MLVQPLPKTLAVQPQLSPLTSHRGQQCQSGASSILAHLPLLGCCAASRSLTQVTPRGWPHRLLAKQAAALRAEAG